MDTNQQVTTSITPGGFQTVLNVSGYSHDEIEVKTDDRFVIIIGEHEEWLPDNGYVAHHFIRRYLLPDSIETSHLTSSFTQDGWLTVTAPRKDGVVAAPPESARIHEGPALVDSEYPRVET